MFEIYKEEKHSAVVKTLRRAAICLGAGALLTILIPSVLFALLDYFRIRLPNNTIMWLLAGVLNAPAVIYCTLFTPPPGLHRSDESLYCYSVGFFFNPFYYALVIFSFWWLIEKMLNRRKSS